MYVLLSLSVPVIVFGMDRDEGVGDVNPYVSHS
jgi:hypothetical protein